MSKMNYKYYILFFLKIMLIIWWFIVGIIITAVTFNATNWYMALIGLFLMSIWVSIVSTAICWSNKCYEESEAKDV